jgi:hypothetical protein
LFQNKEKSGFNITAKPEKYIMRGSECIRDVQEVSTTANRW